MTDTMTHISVPRGVATYVSSGNRHAARFRSHPITSSVVVVSAFGDIDGMSAHTLTEHAMAETLLYCALIIDLSGLEFFGAEGFSALHRISVHCARTGTTWCLVPGAAVSRLLRICDPDGSLPTAETVGAALMSSTAAI